LGCGGTVRFATAFSGRGSHDDRRTRAAHSASDGNADPAGVIEKYPPATGCADEPPGAGVGKVVVVVVVVEPPVGPLGGADGCCGPVVVVVAVGAGERGRLLATVVGTHQRLCGRCDDHFRRAEATGTEIASTTVTAVNTTTNVRSLRLILFPLIDGWELAAGPERTRDRHAGAPDGPCVAPAESGNGAVGSTRPPGGARTCRSRQIRANTM
jgi:hypothetical protein